MPFTINTAYTLAEILKSYDPQGRLHHIIDVFSDKRPIMEEGFWSEANDFTSHEMLQLVSKPTGKFMRLDEGYDREGVATKPVKEQLGSVGSMMEIDMRVLKKQTDPVGWRTERTKLHLRGMLENFNRKFYVGSSATDPKEVDGLCTRYNALGLANVKSLSGSANLYPVFVIKWGLDGAQLLYPKDGESTFKENDRGLVDLLDENGKPYPGYRSYFDLSYGIGVADDRCVQRLVNVDVTAIKGTATFEEALIEVINNLPGLDNAAIYVGRQVMTRIQQRLNSKSNLYFAAENVWGRMMPTFQGLPVIRDDALSTAESAVS